MDSKRTSPDLEETRRSMRSRISRQSLSQPGLPIDLSPVTRGLRQRPAGVGLALGLLGVVALATVWFTRPQEEAPALSGKPVAFLEVSRAPMTLVPAGEAPGRGQLLDLQAETPIPAGTTLETDEGTAALRLVDGGSLRLDRGTRVQLSSGSAAVLEEGAVYLDVQDASGVEIRTTLGVVRDIGTQFEVRLSADGNRLRVRVREGKVILRRGPDGHEATVGEQLVMTIDGTLERGTTPLDGEEWEWVLESAPVPDLEGLDLLTFLRWLAREGGWSLRFEDAELEERAASIRLFGDAQGLDPRQATALVFRSSGEGLSYRMADGALVVERAAAP